MHRRLMLALAPAVLAFAGAAHAQPPADHPPGAQMPDMAAHMAQMKAMHESMMKQHVEDLKTILRLRPDQEAALQAFVAAHHGPGMGMGMGMMHGGLEGGSEGAPTKPMTTPERLDDMAKRDAAMAAEHEKQRQALAKFYAALSPDQQKTFDALQRLVDGHRRMGGMGMHMMMGDGPGGHRMIIRREMHGAPPGPPAHEH